MAGISNDLRTELCQVFVVGFLDTMAGGQVTDDDLIPSGMCDPLAKMAEGSIDGAAAMIGEIFQENPSAVFATVYDFGAQVAATINQAVGPAPIYLN